jgi:hypothetical protein
MAIVLATIPGTYGPVLLNLRYHHSTNTRGDDDGDGGKGEEGMNTRAFVTIEVDKFTWCKTECVLHEVKV